MVKITDSQKKEAKIIFESTKSNIGDEEISECIDMWEKKMERFRKKLPKAIIYLRDNIELLFSMLKDYKSKKYTEVPIKTIFSVTAALLYLFSPIDAIPDFIPVIWFIDDGAILALCLKSIENDLKEYEIRKSKQ